MSNLGGVRATSSGLNGMLYYLTRYRFHRGWLENRQLNYLPPVYMYRYSTH